MGWGIYIHIPFCKQKCFYCDFASTASLQKNTINLYQQYIDALCKEITMYKKLFPAICIDTIYFGGGTPSILPPNLIIQVLKIIKENFSVSKQIEITLEANPGTVDEEKLRYLYENGINRLSFGVQVVQDELLKKIGRIHTIDDADNAINWAKKVGFNNISVDLMYGLPGQTIELLEQSVDWALNKKIQHISIYGLQIEENTVFGKLEEQGKLILPTEEENEMMYDYLTKVLPENNYHRYEISNFALAGYESKHNLSYWQDKFYLGIGAGAHGYYDEKRVENPFDLKSYIEKCNKNILPFVSEEVVDKIAHMEEFCFLGLRMASGIDKNLFKVKFKLNIDEIYGKKIIELEHKGLIINTSTCICLTDKGMKFGNQVFSEFLWGK